MCFEHHEILRQEVSALVGPVHHVADDLVVRDLQDLLFRFQFEVSRLEQTIRRLFVEWGVLCEILGESGLVVEGSSVVDFALKGGILAREVDLHCLVGHECVLLERSEVLDWCLGFVDPLLGCPGKCKDDKAEDEDVSQHLKNITIELFYK